MITITKLSGNELVINCELIESIELTPDTTITLTTGKKVIAKESVEHIIDEIIKYKKKIHAQ